MGTSKGHAKGRVNGVISKRINSGSLILIGDLRLKLYHILSRWGFFLRQRY